MLSRSTPLKRGTSTLKRSAMKPGSGFKKLAFSPKEITDEDGWTRPLKSTRALPQHQPQSERVKSVVTIPDPSLFRLPTHVSSEVIAKPKTPKLRNSALLEMAEGRDCLLRAPGYPSHDPATTVFCHANWSDMEKGGGRKAQDMFGVWGCAPCHYWLDQGPAPYATKRLIFLVALAKQLDAWKVIAESPSEPVRFRKAAKWALEHYGSSGFDIESKMTEAEELSKFVSEIPVFKPLEMDN
ncbi:nuclease domain-containing protein [Comamonas sp. w2-DMI]|uniref:nuclease domain-containing protein n=1 Tax=Comamonas sp. w2-DMI TaxID=3126391 RepID=UPI0032E446DD